MNQQDTVIAAVDVLVTLPGGASFPAMRYREFPSWVAARRWAEEHAGGAMPNVSPAATVRRVSVDGWDVLGGLEPPSPGVIATVQRTMHYPEHDEPHVATVTFAHLMEARRYARRVLNRRMHEPPFGPPFTTTAVSVAGRDVLAQPLPERPSIGRINVVADGYDLALDDWAGPPLDVPATCALYAAMLKDEVQAALPEWRVEYVAVGPDAPAQAASLGIVAGTHLDAHVRRRVDIDADAADTYARQAIARIAAELAIAQDYLVIDAPARNRT